MRGSLEENFGKYSSVIDRDQPTWPNGPHGLLIHKHLKFLECSCTGGSFYRWSILQVVRFTGGPLGGRFFVLYDLWGLQQGWARGKF